MLSKLLIALSLMALCVMIHTIGMVAVVRWSRRQLARGGGDFWPPAWILIRIAAWVIFLHLVQILVWAFLYAWRHAMPEFTTAAYFSAVTYTTTGYGDLVLPEEWRIVGGVEALTGILMCGLSTGMFFAAFIDIFGLNRKGAPSA